MFGVKLEKAVTDDKGSTYLLWIPDIRGTPHKQLLPQNGQMNIRLGTILTFRWLHTDIFLDSAILEKSPGKKRAYATMLLRLAILFLLSCTGLLAKELRVVTVVDPPFYEAGPAGPKGYVVDVINQIIDKLNADGRERYSVQYYVSNQGGRKMQDGSWNGMVGELVKGAADFAGAPLYMTKERREAVYFSHPFITASIVPLIKRPAPGKLYLCLVQCFF